MMKLIVKTQVSETESKEYNYLFDQPVVTIGRLKENDIQLPLSTVSGFHAQILHEGGNYYLVDRGSINGTYLNGQRLLGGEKKLLNDGDSIRVQSFEIYFSSRPGMEVDQGATIQVARQMVMEVLGSWESQSQEKPRLIVMGGPHNGKQVELSDGKSIVIGRGANCDIVIDHPSVSRRHAEVTFSWSGAFIKDLSSANGVYCNDERISATHKLHDRDELRMGQQTSTNPVRIVISNPTEALLSKIEEVQITDSPGAVQSKMLTHPPHSPALSEEARAEEARLPAVVEAAPPEVIVEVEGKATNGQAGVPRSARTKKFGSMAALIVAAVVLIVALAAVAMFLVSGRRTSISGAEPEKGGPGDLITIRGKNLDQIQNAIILQKGAPILKHEKDELQLKIPAFPNLEISERQTEIVLDSEKGTVGRIPFLLVIAPQVESINPHSGKVGSEVRIRAGSGKGSIYFGTNRANVTSASENEIVAIVPEPVESIPPNGLPLPVTVRINNVPSKNSLDFTVFPKPAEPAALSVSPEAFQLTFAAKAYPATLGFNEYAVESNLGPFLVLVAKDEYGSSRARAEAVAQTLNDTIGFFSSDTTAKVTLVKEEDYYSLYAEGAVPDQRKLLLRAFQEDTLAYGKINQRPVGLEDLANWWQMLIGAYYKVFIQFQTPADTGILSVGGTVLQQVSKFYSMSDEKGQKYYKKDFPDSMPADQKTKLLALSFSLPQRISSVEGKWMGTMSNILYSNISEPTLELVLMLHQRADGTISGTAEMNWKIAMGGGTGDFQNVAYKKLGEYGLSGSYKKNNTYPLEFSFVEKDSRRLNFVGRIEGNQLKGSFALPTGEDGVWSARSKQ